MNPVSVPSVDRARPLVVIAAAAIAVFGVAACGTDDGPAAATQPVSEPSATQPPGTQPPGTPAPGTQPPGTQPPASGELAEELDGRTFLSTAVEGQTLVDGSQIRLEFDGARLGVSPGCNSGGATWSLDGDVLSTDEMATTQMACEPAALMDQDTWVIDLLTNRPTLALDGDQLTISGESTTITFTDREVADPDRPLEGTAWTLESIVTADAVSSVPAGMRTPTLSIEGGRLSVDTGCNTGGGEVTVGDGELTVGPVALTRMACADPAANDVETHIAAVLDGTVTFTIEADVLTLSQGDRGLQYRAG